MLTVLAGSGHLAYGTLRLVSVRFTLAARACLGGESKKFLSWAEPALGGPAVSGMTVTTGQSVFNSDTRRRNFYLNL